MKATVKNRAKQLILRTSLWVLSALLMLSASSASAADSLFQQAILVHWAGHQPATPAEAQESAGANNELHHAERKAPRIRVVNRYSPFVPKTTYTIEALASPHVGTHGPGALMRPAYYRFLFRYKPF
ncbi:hypothetical protein [Paraflavitalea sp. CAU 1676]|uniref:hypothetical protein n=1 Tax=Paraflavitalea sp. CAU 1676 TaxID=3032598 RepID=UPI0023D9A520|nr:hypothetical protein [Paraflavitalea sp. CAU 1676]MDF2192367.1 hypothetical protein [Paraflavitalea sp. CAU 1676]